MPSTSSIAIAAAALLIVHLVATHVNRPYPFIRVPYPIAEGLPRRAGHYVNSGGTFNMLDYPELRTTAQMEFGNHHPSIPLSSIF